jgi:Flp pilus assembly protein TadD
MIHCSLRAAAGLALLGLAACASSSGTPSTRSTEMTEGYRAARHGYWQEAHHRFALAAELAPGDAEVLNNLAVALEAVGRFDDAVATYEQALTIAPGNEKLKRNYRLCKEFYDTYVVKDGTAEKKKPAPEEADDEQ